METSLYTIVIVGGGLAGISSAAHLLQHDHLLNRIKNIVIIEANNRLGGRTFSIKDKIDNNTDKSSYNILKESNNNEINLKGIDLGGQWVGPNHKKLINLIEQLGLQLSEQTFTMSNNNNDNNNNVVELVEMVNYQFYSSEASRKEVNLFVKEVERLIELLKPSEIILDNNNNNNNNNNNESNNNQYDEIIKTRKYYDSLTIYDYVNTTTTEEEAKKEILLFVQTILACDVTIISFYFLLFYINNSGGFISLGDGPDGAQKWKIVNGCQQVSDLWIQLLKNKYNNSNNNNNNDINNNNINDKFSVLLSSQVVSIYSNNNKICDGNNENYKSIVIDNNNDYNHESIVSYKNTITNEIESINCNFVIFAASPTVLLKQNIIITPDLPKNKKYLYNNMIMARCVKIIIVYDCCFWDNKIIKVPFNNINNIGLVHNIFDSIVNNKPALVCLITGEFADKYSYNKNLMDRKNTVLLQLHEMYKENLLLKQLKDNFIINPLAYIEKDWCSDEFANGCFAALCPVNLFSFYGNELYTNYNNIYFASTESSQNFYGYMEGAILAGERVAKEILNFNNESK